MNRSPVALLLAAAFALAACSDTEASPAVTSTTVADSGGAIDRPEWLAGLAEFPQFVDVFGVSVIATGSTPSDKVAHAAAVMAQYLDNDANGVADDPAVIAALTANQATLIMGATSAELEDLSEETYQSFEAIVSIQDLYADETNPAIGFDAALEEVHHLLLNYGWAAVFPDELGQNEGSAIADAMDAARGGRFDAVPAAYPEGAWYTYDDRTCDYVCMITEYTYWAHTSLLGGQDGRADEIGHEWRLETAEKVRATDGAAAEILESSRLGLPTVLPDGDYAG